MKSLFYIFLFSLSFSSFAQQADVKFGKNRVQYKKFDWKSISTKNFTIYYYSGGNEIAHNAARYAEMDYKAISNTIGYIPRSKMTLIVYNSIGDAQQSNIGFHSDNYLGGETNFVKSKIEIAFTGTQVGFREEIRYKISKMLLNYMMFGGNLKEVVQSGYMMNLPPWFINGAAAYIAGKHTTNMYDFMYHHIHRKNPDPSKLQGRDAELAGQAIWTYMAEQYGESVIPNLINLTRITHDEKISLITTLNTPYRVFLKEWATHYKNTFIEDQEHIKRERSHFLDWHKYELKHVEFNPDSSLIAYSYHSQGKQKIIIWDTISGKKKQLFVNHFKVIDQATQAETPLIRWKSKTELSYVTYKKGKPYFVTYDLKQGKTVKKQFDYLDQILSFDHSPLNKDEIVVSAVQKGQADIFIYNFHVNHASRVTKDLYDDLYPRYLPNSDRIIFSSNRYGDTLELDPGSFDVIRDSFDLFILSQGSLILERVTKTDFSEFQTVPLSATEFLVVTEQKNRKNTFLINTEENIIHQITAYHPSSIDISTQGNTLGVVRRGKKENRTFITTLNTDTSYFSYLRIKDNKITEESELEKMKYEDAINYLLTVDLDKITFDSSKVDTTGQNIYSILRDIEKIDPTDIHILGPNKYRKTMGLDNFVSSAMLDPLRGLSILMDANMSELFGNHQFSGDLILASDLRSNLISVEYEYLKHRIDYGININRNDLSIPISARYSLTSVEFTGSYPFNQVSRFYFTPSYTTTGIADLISITTNNIYNSYVGYNTGFVFDNTSIFGLNMMRGTRGKVSYSHQYDIGNSGNSFGEFRTDLRHYQKIFNELTLAIRGSYGKYSGGGAKRYLLGGMDNWFIAQTDGLEQNPLDFSLISEDLLFLDYVTGLRGYNYNRLNGRQHLLFNAEMRMPIARLIKNRPIQSKFYKSLQFITFYDLGTAWNTGNIFTKANDRSTEFIDSSPFDITVTKYTSPFLGSYGFGLRTMLMGYYMKMDLAWGVENYNVNRAKFYLTLGYDF